MEKNKRLNHRKKLFYIVIILLMIEFLNSFLRYCNVIDLSISICIRKVIFIVLGGGFVLLSFITEGGYVRISKRFIIGTFFVLYCLISYMLKCESFNLTDVMNLIMTPMISYMGFKIGFLSERKSLDILITIYLVVMTYLYFVYVRNGDYRSLPAAITSMFFVLLFLPIVLTFKTKVVKFAMMSLIVFLTFVTMKSTAVLIILLVFLSFYFWNAEKYYIRLLLFPILGLIAMLILLYIAKRFWGIDLYSELILENIQEGGNGRTEIWYDVVNRYVHNGLWDKIFGSGYEAVARGSTSIYKYSAHNDFLEILYDFGIVGIIPFLVIVFNCIKEFLYMIKVHYCYTALFGGLLAESMVLFLFSNAYFQSSYYLLVAFLLFSVLKHFDKEQYMGHSEL